MVKVRRKRVSFWAEVPSKKRTRVEFKSKGKKVKFLAKGTARKKISFYARRK